jgi:rod shape-determining protein MreD
MKGNVMNHLRPVLWDIDLVTVTLGYLLMAFGGTKAGIFAFVLGILMDIFSAGLLGLFTLIYLLAVLLIKLGSNLFDLSSAGGQMLIVTITVFLEKMLFLVLLYLFSFKVMISTSQLGAFVSTAVCSGLISPVIFYFFKQLTRLSLPEMAATPPDQVID